MTESSLPKIDYKKLTEAELRSLNKGASTQLQAIEAERKRKAELKRNYKLVEPPIKTEFNYFSAWVDVVKSVNAGIPVDQALIDALTAANTRELTPERRIVYPCPECGAMNLRPGEYDTHIYRTYHKIQCDSCDFVCNASKTDGKEYYSWELFHQWLIKKKYIPEGTPFR